MFWVWTQTQKPIFSASSLTYRKLVGGNDILFSCLGVFYAWTSRCLDGLQSMVSWEAWDGMHLLDVGTAAGKKEKVIANPTNDFGRASKLSLPSLSSGEGFLFFSWFPTRISSLSSFLRLRIDTGGFMFEPRGLQRDACACVQGSYVFVHIDMRERPLYAEATEHEWMWQWEIL